MKKLLFVFIVLLALCGSVFAGPMYECDATQGATEGIVAERYNEFSVKIYNTKSFLGYASYLATDVKNFYIIDDYGNIDNYISATAEAIDDDTLIVHFTLTNPVYMKTCEVFQANFLDAYGQGLGQGVASVIVYLTDPEEKIYSLRENDSVEISACEKSKANFYAKTQYRGNVFNPLFEVSNDSVIAEVNPEGNFNENTIPAFIEVKDSTPTKITMKLQDQGVSDIWYSYKFFVNAGNPTSVEAKKDTYTVNIGSSVNIGAYVLPEDSYQGVVYVPESGSEEYFDVDSEGNITGKKITDKAYAVTIKSEFNENITKTVFVTVEEVSKSIIITKEDGTVPTKVKNTQDVQLKATVLPAGVDQDVIWSSSDENILKVSETGVVSAISNGTAIITATSVADPSVSADVEIKSFISIKDVKLYYKGTDTEAPKSIVLTPGNSASFEVRFDPADATEKTIKWKNQNNNVADIISADQYFNDVTITAITGGKTQFSYVTKNSKGSGLTVYVPWFKVNKPSINVRVGDDPVKANVVLYPDALRETENVEYVIEDPEIISIDANGYITGLKKGTTTFYANACGIESEVVTVNVESEYVPVEGISFKDTKLYLHTSDEYTFNVIFNPINASDQRLTWKVSNKSVLSIENGKIVALANGYSKVEARSVDGKKVAVCDVYVTDKVSDFKLSKASVTLGVGETTKITASFKPKEISGTIEWFVGDDTVAAINTNNTVCNITGVGLGDTKVYARVDGITLECVVTVEEPVVTEE